MMMMGDYGAPDMVQGRATSGTDSCWDEGNDEDEDDDDDNDSDSLNECTACSLGGNEE